VRPTRIRATLAGVYDPDGYSKLHQFEFGDDNGVSFRSKFVRSGFYENSVTADDIAFNVMAQPTEPPLNPLGFFSAPNDNNNVNVIKMGDEIQILSDTPTLLGVDPKTLNSTHEYAGMSCHIANTPCSKLSGLDSGMEVGAGGTAHPLFLANGTMITLLELAKPMPEPWPEQMVKPALSRV